MFQELAYLAFICKQGKRFLGPIHVSYRSASSKYKLSNNLPCCSKKSRETLAHESIIIRDAVGANYQDCYWSPLDSLLCSSLWFILNLDIHQTSCYEIIVWNEFLSSNAYIQITIHDLQWIEQDFICHACL